MEKTRLLIREIIYLKMEADEKKITALSKEMGVFYNNISAYLYGRASLPVTQIEELCTLLKISLWYNGEAYNGRGMFRNAIKNVMKEHSITSVKVASALEINKSSFSCFLNGKRTLSHKYLDRLLEYFKRYITLK